MKFRNIFRFLSATVLATSCAATQIAYFQDVTLETPEQVQIVNEIRVQPEDELMILVSSKEPMLMTLFNLPYNTRQIGSNSESASGSRGTLGYTVRKDGTIDFPILGSVHIAGMTREEIATYLKERLISENLVNDPIITVDFMNLTITVLGEVAHPGRFNIDKDRLTILEALGMAGDLTVFGKRENVLVQREDDNGEKVFYTVNLNSVKELYESPVYYMKQNDVIYVEPNRTKAGQATVNGNTVRSAGFWMSLVSFLASMTSTVLVLSK